MKKITALLLALLTLLSLCACGAKSASPADLAPMAEEAYFEESGLTYAEDSAAGFAVNGYSYDEPAEAPAPEAQPSNSSGETASFDDEKIIYSGSAFIETRDFDATCEGIRQMIAYWGGFLESSSVRGSNYYTDGHRSADYTIRIPRSAFSYVTENLSALGNVTSCTVSAENIGGQYHDTESRLSTYRVEEERLLAMLAKCETVEDMLNIEDRLADVRYNIESLTTTLNSWDSLVNYSTLTLSVTEVREYTPEPEPGYWRSIGLRFVNTLKGVGNFFAELLAFIIAALPVLVLLGLVALAVVYIVKACKKRRAKKKGEKEE